MGFKGLFLITTTVFLLTGVKAYADQRSYVWTYEYLTMPKGKVEIEYYHTTKIPNTSDADINTMKHQIELEYGITDHWDIALYQRFEQKNNKKEVDLTYDVSKLRMRYRFGEKGQFIVDPLFYLEYIRSGSFSEPNVFEAKIILAKNIGNFNFVYNQIFKQEVERGSATEYEYALGANYRLSPKLSIGLESKGNYTDGKFYLGPTLSYSLGKNWVAFGIVQALNSESDDIQTRLIFGIPL